MVTHKIIGAYTRYYFPNRNGVFGCRFLVLQHLGPSDLKRVSGVFLVVQRSLEKLFRINFGGPVFVVVASNLRICWM